MELALAFHLPSQVFVSTRNLDAACCEKTETGRTLAIIEPCKRELPRFSPASTRHWQVDVRSADLSMLDQQDSQ